jgi:Flp pilus assembly secretin CpaC
VFTVAPQSQARSLPRERSSTIVSEVLLDSGQTAILGCLSTDSDQETVSDVPFFSDIPLLGWFFQHKARTRDKQMLWVFVTPTVVRTSADQQKLIEREILSRHDAYGERLQQILYGDDADMSGHELMKDGQPISQAAPTDATQTAAPAPAALRGDRPGDHRSGRRLPTTAQTPAGQPPAPAGQWATFVQTPPIPPING